MIQTDTPVARFLTLYARNSNQDDMTPVASHFADPFLSAGPTGTQSVRVADFAAALPKKKALFDRLRSQPTELVSIIETPLDSRYVLAQTAWRFSFLNDSGPAHQIDTKSTFLIDTGLSGTSEADFKIVLYLSHHDLMQILRDRGILNT
jgi:hypothetical protein